jgi:hypothetical protein
LQLTLELEAIMSKRTATWVLVIAATLPSSVEADSPRPVRNFRQVDRTGRFYIVVKKNGGPADPGAGTPVTFEIAERKAASPPLVAAEDPESAEPIVPNPDVKVREGDLILGRGSLKRCPKYIVISSTGLGFVGMDVRGHNYGDLRSDDAVVIVSKDGSVRYRKSLINLFSEKEVELFTHTMGSVLWCDGGWIDEHRKEAIVVGRREWPGDKPIPRLFRIVNLETGAVRVGSSAVVLTALSESNLGALDEALDLAAELQLAQAKPDLVRFFSDDKLAIQSRLRAGVALAALGDRRGAGLMKNTVFEASPGRTYAIRYLPYLMGKDAPPVLCDLVRRFGAECSNRAWDAMHWVPVDAAVPAVLALLREQHCPVCIDFAVECLAIDKWKPKAAIPDLIKLLESKPETRNPLWTQRLAAVALGSIGREPRQRFRR